jgi:hypothetical protein
MRTFSSSATRVLLSVVAIAAAFVLGGVLLEVAADDPREPIELASVPDPDAARGAGTGFREIDAARVDRLDPDRSTTTLAGAAAPVTDGRAQTGPTATGEPTTTPDRAPTRDRPAPSPGPAPTTPSAPTPTVTLPPATSPTVTLPPVVVPTVSLPPVSLPPVTLPPVDPTQPPVTVTVPPVSLPPVDPSIPPITVPPLTLPPIFGTSGSS